LLGSINSRCSGLSHAHKKSFGGVDVPYFGILKAVMDSLSRERIISHKATNISDIMTSTEFFSKFKIFHMKVDF
jgi:hypothetical protein